MWFLLSVAGHEPFRAGHAFMDRAPWLAESGHVLREQLGLSRSSRVEISGLGLGSGSDFPLNACEHKGLAD